MRVNTLRCNRVVVEVEVRREDVREVETSETTTISGI